MTRFFLVLILLFLPTHALALAGDWQEDEAVAVRLISGVAAVGNEAVIPLGLEIKLAKGWHSYWRSPGDAGLPPQLDWSRSLNEADNLQSVNFLYPTPRRESHYGMESIGYRDHIVFPIDATLRQAGHALRAGVTLDLMTCSSVCLPNHFDLSLVLPEGPADPSSEAMLLHLARDQLPSDSSESGILLKNVGSDGESLTFTISSRERITQPDIFIENDKNVGFGAPEVEIAPSGFAADLKVKPVDNLPAGVTLAKLPMTLTIVNGDRSTEIKASASTALPSPAAFVPEAPPFGVLLLFALIGGFILNLMPCVLPVLSLKIVSAIGHGGGEEKKVRQSFFVTAAGIMSSFLVLATAMVVLKRLELTLGWGVQFQQPAFLMFLVLLLTLFAANLWGLFEVPLPRFLADRMDGSHHSKLAGDFATGAFATLLATPCSAPFLGTAVGFALAAGAKEIFCIFMILGVGMALPYFAVGFFPRAAILLPKPGAWMVVLRRVMGAALALTAAWLVWIMTAQITASRAFAFAEMMIALTLLLALKKRGAFPKATTIGIVAVCMAAFAIGLWSGSGSESAAEIDRQWLKYAPAMLRADIDEGRTVFLDVTANWCLTCKANKRFVLSSDEIARRLFHSDVVAMQANWTNPDPAVSDLLHKYGRYGIPFNIVFGPRAPQGIVLPELLTGSAVLKALDEASGVKTSEN